MNNQNIAGIHNYCDRWCERCTFTSRCAIFEDVARISPEGLDTHNKAFWDRVGQNFAKAKELLHKAAAEAGFDLSSPHPDIVRQIQRDELLEMDSRQHPLALASLEYSRIGHDWLKTQPGMLDRLENLKTELTLGIETEEGARRETKTIGESIAVIQWYLIFIHSKLSRALAGKATDDDRGEENDFPRDHDGSAKIALIAIDRSIHAWTALFQILPEHEDHFLKVLSILQKIKTMTIVEFPEAMAFMRPGFDA
mgnify:CR=1 FL=1